IPEKVTTYYDRFRTCPSCKRIFWEGSHWKRMHGWLDQLLSEDKQRTATPR
ncbi:MAG: twitching motility protein PilT, partial [Burkholderiales bacterium]|nr:twitching motility protein PilT [Burkholderiales bacterium]